jgi:hypothetical protein
MRDQQECILSGGVYLLHRLKDSICLSYDQSITQLHKGVQDRRSGVMACKKRNYTGPYVIALALA